MIKNYLIINFRNLLKNRVYFIINILGLSIALTCGVLAIAFIFDEYSFDKFHSNGNNLYRLNKKNINRQTGVETLTMETSGMMGPTMVREFPEVKDATRVMPWFDDEVIGNGDNTFKVDKLVFADENFFRIFDFKLKQGNPTTALQTPLSMVISEGLAQKLFPDASAIGMTVTGLHNLDFQITGIIENPPRNSHIQYDVLVSWSTTTPGIGPLNYDFMNNWLGQTVYTYLLLEENSEAENLSAKLGGFMERNFPERADSYFLYLQPFKDIYLKSFDILGSRKLRLGSAQFISIFAVTAIFLLLIACINYININTARATQRNKEVGIRKVMGATRGQLIRQFMGESLLIAIIAALIAILAVDFSIPLFNQLTGKTLSSGLLWSWPVIGSVVVLLLNISLISGIYPSVFLSKFQPNSVLRTSSNSKITGHLPREILTTFQFVVSIILIAGAILIDQQINYFMNKDLGFNKEQVLVITLDNNVAEKWEAFQEEMEKHPQVVSTAVCQASIGSGTFGTTVLPEGMNEEVSAQVFRADFDFIKTFGMEIVDGYDFNPDLNPGSSGLIINQAFVNLLGWTEPIGKRIKFSEDGPKYPVTGVVKDFHYNALTERKIDPVVMYIYPQNFTHINIRITGNNVPETLDFMKSLWGKYESRFPFTYYFVDDWFNEQYQPQAQLLKIVTLFSLISIIIATMGLYGLVSFTIVQRTREISIRKVFGASIQQITRLINIKFIRLVMVAIVIGSPLTFWLIQKWVENFAYPISVGPWVFMMTGLAIAFMVVGVVSFHALRAGTRNPVDALRNNQ